MQRTFSATLELTLAGRANLVFAIAAARPGDGATLTESMRCEGVGGEYEPVEIQDLHGTRLHQFTAEAGGVTVHYEAELTGRSGPPPAEPLDLITYLRPSRYAQSDSLFPTALAEFGGLTGKDLLAAVSSWVGSHLSYVPGSSGPTDGATHTLLDRRGVCRDYAHLCVALLRALDVPARVVSAYAPGLQPMDFHAVCEALVDGIWHVVDATTLAPRQSLVRIATGRDAADTAFLTSHGGWVTLQSLTVTAVADELPGDDVRSFVALG